MKLFRLHRDLAPRHAFAALVIGLATLAAMVLPPTSAFAGTTSADRTGQMTKPTVVLVHGAFADASSWDAVVAGLQQRGYPVIAPPNPLRGVASDSAYLASILATIPGPVILVGHSYGGMVITNAARTAHNVKALVYVAAYVPEKGESAQSILSPQKFPGSELGPTTLVARPFPDAAAPKGVGVDLYINPAAFRAAFAADVPARQAALMAATQRPLALAADLEPSGVPAWKTLPSWDLITTQDHAIPPAGQLFMAKRAGAHIFEVQSSHAVMVSHPNAVVAIILQAAAHTH
jgi:pimeloyl-ACP methyl ester carboxylesterase